MGMKRGAGEKGMKRGVGVGVGEERDDGGG